MRTHVELSPRVTVKLRTGESGACGRARCPGSSPRLCLRAPGRRTSRAAAASEKGTGRLGTGARGTCFSERFIPFKFCANWLYIYLKDLRGKKRKRESSTSGSDVHED